MDLFDDESGSFLMGFVIGAAVAYYGRDVIEETGRPVTKAALKAGLIVYEKGRRQMARLSEDLEDMMVEVIAERQMQVDDLDVEDESEDATVSADGDSRGS